jgi:hypothetical protein
MEKEYFAVDVHGHCLVLDCYRNRELGLWSVTPRDAERDLRVRTRSDIPRTFCFSTLTLSRWPSRESMYQFSSSLAVACAGPLAGESLECKTMLTSSNFRSVFKPAPNRAASGSSLSPRYCCLSRCTTPSLPYLALGSEEASESAISTC